MLSVQSVLQHESMSIRMKRNYQLIQANFLNHGDVSIVMPVDTYWRKIMYKVLKNKIEEKSAKVGVIGLGYVGLPLAVAFAEEGFKKKAELCHGVWHDLTLFGRVLA